MNDRKFLQETNFDDDINFDDNKENEVLMRRLRQNEQQQKTWANSWLNPTD